MNASEYPEPPPNTITVRVGCTLAYEATRPAMILLLIKPQGSAEQLLVEEELVASNGAKIETAPDSHGNIFFKTTLHRGLNEFRHDAIFYVPNACPDRPFQADGAELQEAPMNVLRYTMPSRYCESDKLMEFAREKFGRLRNAAEQAQAICDWTHANIEYRYGSGSCMLSALDVMQRGYGVCRDFAHIMIALCRALDIPARYVAGHMPYLGIAEGDIGIDFHAYCEVYLTEHWHTYDPRHNRPHVGRIKIAHGMDAVDAAFATIYGDALPVQCRVWAYQVDYPVVRIGDPVAISIGDDGTARLAVCA